MPQLEINGINLPINPALHTWQELLEELESKHDKDLTDVEIPDFTMPATA
jgi:hypothetical protein